MASDTSSLFRPFSLSRPDARTPTPTLTLPNRIVMAPMTRRKSPGGVPGANVADYYARRACGGVGLIISEGTFVDHPAANGYADVPAFYGSAALAGWRDVVRAVHAEGGKIFPQLWHVGSVRKPDTTPDQSVPGYSPSGLAKPGGRVVGHVMSESDIADVIAAFGKGARAAKELGFDGVELHGAHGYLIDQFFWEGLNQRSDAYGGSLEARTRFAVEVIREVRRELGPELPICLRYSQWKLQDYTAKLAHSPAELTRLLGPLADAGVDLFHCSTRRFYEPEFEGSSLNLAGWTKKLTGKPAITVGSVGLDTEFASQGGGGAMNAGNVSDLSVLLERLRADEFDLVAIGRALIADPEWPHKVQRGRTQELRAFDRQMLEALA